MLVFKGKLREHPRNEVENELYRFRNRVFSDRLGWDVESHRGLERDSFDTPDTHWVLIEDEQGVCGCIRLLSCSTVPMPICCPPSSPPPLLVNAHHAAQMSGN